jgi:hypothetical protein
VRLTILLYVLLWKLRRAAKGKPGFRRMLAKRDYTLVIRTADGRRGRFFTFLKGDIISMNGLHPKPDVEMVWVNPAVAFRAMAAGSEKPVIQALGKSQLKIEGNLDYFFWFGEVLKEMMAA